MSYSRLSKGSSSFRGEQAGHKLGVTRKIEDLMDQLLEDSTDLGPEMEILMVAMGQEILVADQRKKRFLPQIGQFLIT